MLTPEGEKIHRRAAADAEIFEERKAYTERAEREKRRIFEDVHRRAAEGAEIF